MELELRARDGSLVFLAYLLLAGATCTGCTSIWYRKYGTESGVYRGTRRDAELIAHPDRTNDKLPVGIAFPLTLVDLPLSGALDTVLLPADLVRNKRNEPEGSERVQDECAP
jgi:uncharacterized protein YceK